MSLMLLLLATRLPAGDAAVPPPAPAEPCAPGHLAPVWTAADWRPLSPTEGRCLVTDPLPKGEGWWHLCGGVEAGGDGRVPGHCPAAPGGLALAPHPLASSSPEWDGPTHLVGLDCPGRWRAAAEGDAVTVTLEATGPGACPAPATTSWSFGSTGAAVVPPDPADLPERAVLPPGLQAAGEADRTSWTGGAHLQLVWTTGPVAGRLGGFDVRLGEAAAWNDLDVVVEDGA